MRIFLDIQYVSVAYNLTVLYLIIYTGMTLIGGEGIYAWLGCAFLFTGLGTWAAVTGMIGPGVAQ